MDRMSTITDQSAADLLTTAVEGGTNYWAAVSDIKRDADLNVLSVKFHEEDYYKGTLFTPYGQYDEVGRSVDLNAIKNAVERILTEKIEFVGSRFIEELDRLRVDPEDVSWDADTADVVVQVAIFGKVVYG